MTSLLRDVRFALRLLRRTPGFTAVAVVTLALGIGATTAIFSVVYGLFFAPLPYVKADRLVMIWERANGDRRSVSPAAYLEFKRQATAFVDINAWGGGPVNLATNDRPENVVAGLATPGFLAMLGYGHPLALGRTFTDEEGIPGNDQVVLLTYRLWKDRFAGDPKIVGKAVRIDDRPYTVVGVLGEGPADHQQNKIWMPMAFTEEQRRSDDTRLLVMARLKDGVELPEANASLAALAAAIERNRATPREARTVSVEPFRNNFVSDSTKRGVWLLLGAVGFLLLIACANVANLLLTRGTARRREVAIRTSIGASRGAVVRQLIVESVVLALAGGLLGALLARVVIDAIVALMPIYTLPSETEIVLSVPVLIFALVTCTIAGLLAGAAPAWRTSRTGVAEVLKEGSRSVSAGRDRLRRSLIAVEFALALTLLAGGAMALQALVKLMTVDLGFTASRLVTFQLPVARDRFAGPEPIEAFYRLAIERIGAMPGVASVSVSTGMPVRGVNFGSDMEIVGRTPADPNRRSGGGINMVTPEYYRTFGITTTAGRTFTDRDRRGSTPVAIVNETFARRVLGDGNPIGQRIVFRPFAANTPQRGAPVTWEVVGVRRDTANDGPGRQSFPEIDVPFWQLPWPQTRVAVRTTGDPSSVIASLGDVVRGLDPTLPLTNVETIEETISQATASDRFYTVFFAAFAAVALILAAVGIYGVMSFAVAQRTHEIGLRMAMGARRGQVLGQILREGMTTALIGTAIGGVGAALIGRLLSGAVYGVETNNPLTFAAVAALLLSAALIACFLPARRAATVDPMIALRQD
jgi:putative ABC transport system permease protein